MLPHLRQVRQSLAVLDSVFIYAVDSIFLVSRNLDSEFQTLAGFQSPEAEIQIPKPRIPNSTGKNFPDFGIWIALFMGPDMASNKELSLLWLYCNECGRTWSNEIKYKHVSKIVWVILYTVSKMPDKAIKLYTIAQEPL